MTKKLTFLFFAIFLCASWRTPVFRKGCSGHYYIIGTALKSDNSIIKNAELTVKFGKDIKIIQTSKTGQFEINIPWTSSCPSGLSKEELRLENERKNPHIIYITHGDKVITLENNWEKYADCFPDSKDAVTWKKDLNF